MGAVPGCTWQGGTRTFCFQPPTPLRDWPTNEAGECPVLRNSAASIFGCLLPSPLELYRDQECVHPALPIPCSHSGCPPHPASVGMRPKSAKLAAFVTPRRVKTRWLCKREGSFGYYFRNTLWPRRAHFSLSLEGPPCAPRLSRTPTRAPSDWGQRLRLGFSWRRQDAGRADSGPAVRSSVADTASPCPRGPRHLPRGPARRPGTLGVDPPGRRSQLVGVGGSRERFWEQSAQYGRLESGMGFPGRFQREGKGPRTARMNAFICRRPRGRKQPAGPCSAAGAGSAEETGLPRTTRSGRSCC